MTFKDVLAQVIDWLQQDKRLSYWALKRQFDLEDAYLEDLKLEMVKSWGRSGFNVFCGPRIQPGEEEAIESLARYIISVAFSQERMTQNAGPLWLCILISHFHILCESYRKKMLIFLL